jgi:hypothetical protein
MVLLAFLVGNWGNYPWLESFNYLPFLGREEQKIKTSWIRRIKKIGSNPD